MAELVVDVGVGSRNTGFNILVIRYDSGVSEQKETKMAGEINYNIMMMNNDGLRLVKAVSLRTALVLAVVLFYSRRLPIAPLKLVGIMVQGNLIASSHQDVVVEIERDVGR